ncbi:larval cuticle protein A2B-like [Episyrphus balteatus]|uniref:larval cuticle protein A2B-like n=1 Tax=Episyrphus balteatus TaxID=286459 RepID=UPI0024858C47|nr:larval cuticle protein A2B-like [Episyrphus balteatus]
MGINTCALLQIWYSVFCVESKKDNLKAFAVNFFSEMTFKFVVLFAFIAVASAGLLPVKVKTIAAEPVLAKAEEEYDPHPQYKFAYDVEDVISGDSKRQVEARDGDVVQGEYSLNDADGFRRTVQYMADPINGFNAVVLREPLVKDVGAVAVPAATLS